jgi:glycosyltransferase involved in cell wall biosynthesis
VLAFTSVARGFNQLLFVDSVNQWPPIDVQSDQVRKPLRVLIAHNRYRRPGGEERHVELLERGLTQAGVEVHRFERNSAELDRSVTKRATAALTLAYRPGGGGITRALAERRPSVVHFHNLWPLLTPSALRAAKTSGAAVVLTLHNYRFACAGGTLLRKGVIHEDCIEGSSLRCALGNPRENWPESLSYGVALEVQRKVRMLARWVDAFVAPSKFMAGMLVRSGLPRERVHVIPYGVPISVTPPLTERRFALFVGRLVPEKGVRTLLSASRLEPKVPLVIAGDGPLASEAQATGDVTRYVGALDRESVSEALHQAAFTVVPSEWYDNLPFSALESFAAGRAVIATRIGGLPEIVDDGITGRLVPPNDAPALAAAIAGLWRNPDRSMKMGERAQTVAEERFELERQTSQLLALYADLTAG